MRALPVGPWAILRSHLDGYRSMLRAESGDLLAEADPERIAAMYAARGDGRQGTVAVVPILGPITKRDSMFSLLFGGTSTTRLVAQLRQLAADESVATVLLNVDSPGGTVSGLPEVAAEVRRLAESKRVVAIANDLAASAAYWIAAQADEIVAVPEALVGSVGVYSMHEDWSGALGQAGIDVTYIAQPPEKVEGNPDEPLSEEARENMQALVDSAYALFVADVAEGRSRATGQKVSAADVRRDYGKGRVLDAKDARAAGMVDRIGTYSETLARLAGGRRADASDAPTLIHAGGVQVMMSTPVLISWEPEQTDDMAAARLELDLDRWRLHR